MFAGFFTNLLSHLCRSATTSEELEIYPENFSKLNVSKLSGILLGMSALPPGEMACGKTFVSVSIVVKGHTVASLCNAKNT